MIVLQILFGIVLCFAFVLFFGAPYLPSHRRQSEIALDLLKLKKGQTLYELGCGDGRILRSAAKRGIKSVGYELNPIVFFVALIWCWPQRDMISVRYGNFWATDLSNADGVYTFLLKKFMFRLDKKLEQELKPGTKLASYVFEIPGKKPLTRKEAVFIYQY